MKNRKNPRARNRYWVIDEKTPNHYVGKGSKKTWFEALDSWRILSKYHKTRKLVIVDNSTGKTFDPLHGEQPEDAGTPTAPRAPGRARKPFWVVLTDDVTKPFRNNEASFHQLDEAAAVVAKMKPVYGPRIAILDNSTMRLFNDWIDVVLPRFLVVSTARTGIDAEVIASFNHWEEACAWWATATANTENKSTTFIQDKNDGKFWRRDSDDGGWTSETKEAPPPTEEQALRMPVIFDTVKATSSIQIAGIGTLTVEVDEISDRVVSGIQKIRAAAAKLSDDVSQLQDMIGRGKVTWRMG